MKCEMLPHGFRLHDILEVKCIASNKENERRKWCVVRLLCGSGKFIDVEVTPRTMTIRSDHKIIPHNRKAKEMWATTGEVGDKP